MNTLAEVAAQTWDVLIVGAGMGGGTLGYALAREGKRVLFCEQGRNNLLPIEANRGTYAELFFPKLAVPGPEHREMLLRSGRWADFLEDGSSRLRRHIPFIGAGTGGSSALYGAAMERFFPEDFSPASCYPPEPDADLPENWPITYEDLAPFYAKAEALYEVRGDRDPLRPYGTTETLRPGPELGPANRALAQFLTDQGLHPYRLPAACRFLLGCQTCQGFLCPRECKMDAGSACLEPAIRDHGAQLLEDCQILRLEADQRRVTGVICQHRGQTLKLQAETVVLAAGALATPTILLRSASRHWPDGLANTSSLVGRNLMRHYIDLVALTPRIKPQRDENTKELAFSDFYYRNGEKFGTVQSFGRLPPAGMLAESLQNDVSEKPGGRTLAAAVGLFKPVLRPLLRAMFDNALILATTLEDLPHRENRVVPAGTAGMRITYRLSGTATRRIERFRRLITDTFAPWHSRVSLLKQAENNDRIAHVCGTCRMGDDSRRSVVDRFNRAHGVENLYVVDASFFPTSAGINPSLTIAANALRVADHLMCRPDSSDDVRQRPDSKTGGVG